MPLRLSLSPFRFDARRPLAGIKSTSYLDHQLAWREAVRRGYDEAVVCSSEGALCECARANLFWVVIGELRTPSLDSGCLPGIARALLLEWLPALGLSCREGLYMPHELATADEVFITAATTGPRPVTGFYDAVDAAPMSGIEHSYAAPGPVTRLLTEKWVDSVAAREATAGPEE